MIGGHIVGTSIQYLLRQCYFRYNDCIHDNLKMSTYWYINSTHLELSISIISLSNFLHNECVDWIMSEGRYLYYFNMSAGYNAHIH
jgi:hypothetical protein